MKLLSTQPNQSLIRYQQPTYIFAERERERETNWPELIATCGSVSSYHRTVDFRLRSALIFPGMSLPHPLAFDAAAVDTDLDRASATASSYSSSTSLHPAVSGGFRNEAQPQTRDLGGRAWSLLPPGTATERERATRRSRLTRLCPRPNALTEEEEAEGDAQEQGRGHAQSGQSRRRRSRRQCGHTPPHGRDGCLRQRQSLPGIVARWKHGSRAREAGASARVRDRSGERRGEGKAARGARRSYIQVVAFRQGGTSEHVARRSTVCHTLSGSNAALTVHAWCGVSRHLQKEPKRRTRCKIETSEYNSCMFIQFQSSQVVFDNDSPKDTP
jgi:hypothetical protein